ncbi:MAG TPA: MFS transporter [Verrucomicrobiae bacterium]|nr:MFS transporter [Verrucomicrobiae bacterium]
MTPSPERPTRVRYWVIVFAVTLAVVTYIDRVSISRAAPDIRKDLGLDSAQMGLVFSVFGWAYALFEIPSGYLGDWFGPRRVLTRVVIWWSFFTAATGWAWSYAAMLVTRTLFGAGEAGCFPNLTKSFSTWLPKKEHVRAQGIMWMSARWGGAFTPPLVGFVMRLVGWRGSFEIFGFLGIIWAVIFYRWYRDDPRQNPHLNQGERALLRETSELASGHGDVPWLKLLGSLQVWMLCWQYFFLSYGWYFYITWLPTYLKEAHHVDLSQSEFLSVLPLFFGGAANPISVWAGHYITRWTGSVTSSRRILSCIGFSGACGFLLYATTLRDPLPATLALAMASFSNDLVIPPAWGSAMDVGGAYAGTVSGAMNTWGNIGGALCPLVIGYILKWRPGDWNLTIYVSAAIYALGIVCWLLLDPVTPLEGGIHPARGSSRTAS